MFKVTHKELKETIKAYYQSKISLFTWGTFGIGKSFIFRETARELAQESNREFKEWNLLTEEDKILISKHPEKYFILVDIRLSEYDAGDIKGLPSFRDDGNTIDWKIPRWAKYTTLENSKGMILFDEINLAPIIVQSNCYKILYDRVVVEDKLGDEWGVFGAGNLESDNAYIHTIPSPLKDRGGEVELITPSVEDWTLWASNNNIDSRILAFVNFKPSVLYKVDFKDGQKYTTTRGWERLNKLIKDKKVDDTFELCSCSAIGEGIAREFIAFSKLQDKINFEEIINNPQKLKEVKEISIIYLLSLSVAERYKIGKLDIIQTFKFTQVLEEVKAELVALIWKILLGSCEKKFRSDFTKAQGSNNDIAQQIKRYAEII